MDEPTFDLDELKRRREARARAQPTPNTTAAQAQPPRAQPQTPTPARSEPPPLSRLASDFMSSTGLGRVGFGAIRDAIQSTINAGDDIDDVIDGWTRDHFGYVEVGKRAKNGVIEFIPAEAVHAGKTPAPVTPIRLPEVEAPKSTAGKITRGFGEFAAEMVGPSKILKGLGWAGGAARVGRPLLAGTAAAFTNSQATESNLANLAEHLGLPKNVITDALAVDEDDSDLEARLKSAAADGLVGGTITEGVLHGLGQAITLVKGIRSTKAEAERALELADDPALRLPEVAPQKPQEAPRTPSATQPAETLPKAATDSPGVTAGPSGSQPDLFPGLPELKPPTVAEQVEAMAAGFGPKVARLGAAEKEELAQAILSGTEAPYLERMGFDPRRVDFARLLGEGGERAVEQIDLAVRSVAEAVQPLAEQVGSGVRTWKETARNAALLSLREGDILKLHANTRNLDGHLFAQRQVLAGSARQLVDAAEAAKAAGLDAESVEMARFLERLDAHASLTAHFKGTTSNLGRALNSLKATVSAREGLDAARRLEAAKRATGKLADDVTDTAVEKARKRLAGVTGTRSEDQRRALVEAVLKNGGDLDKLTHAAERLSGPTRWARAIREYSTGNLFSGGTAAANAFGGTAHIVMRQLARVPLALNPFNWAGRAGRREFVAERAAQSAYMAAFSGGVTEAGVRTFGLIAKEFGSELDLLLKSATSAENSLTASMREGLAKLDDKLALGDQRFARAEAGVRDKAWSVSPETLDVWKSQLDHGPAILRAGWRTLVGGLGTTFNALGSASRAATTLAIGATDELVGTSVYVAARRGEAARFAAREAFDRGLQGDAFATYVAKRSAQFLQDPAADLLDRVERLVASGAYEGSEEVDHLLSLADAAFSVDDLAKGEARRVLFQDELSGFSRGTAKFLDEMQGGTGLIVPFIRTPLRIIETVVGDYSPLGLASKEVRRSWAEALRGGGVEAQLVVTRMALGTTALATAYALAAGDALVGNDGGPNSAARLSRPAYSVKVGGQWVEYGRLDPLGMLLGFGADLYEREQQLAEAEDDDGEAANELARHAASIWYAISSNILAKSYLTSLRDLVDLATSAGKGGAASASATDRVLTSLAARAVPAGGFIRNVEEGGANVLRETHGMWEKAQSAWFSADQLPVRRDGILGRPVPYSRVAGIKVSHDEADPLLRELAEIGYDVPYDPRTRRGVPLTSAQYARFKELRGQVVRDETGRTLEETLRAGIESDAWKQGSKKAKLRAVRKVREEYGELATKALAAEDPEFAFGVLREKRRRELELELPDSPEKAGRIRSDLDELRALFDLK